MPMTQSTVVGTDIPDASEAGIFLGTHIDQTFSGASPDVVILFASSQYDNAVLLKAIQGTCHPGLLVGCSSAGEFTSDRHGTQSAVAVALRSSEMEFAAGLGRGLSSDQAAVGAQIVCSFRKPGSHSFRYHTALVFADALSGYTDELIEQLALLTAGDCQMVGGGAGDDAQFQRTHVFFGTEAHTDAAVALEILSNKPVGIGVSHGWQPVGRPLRVTEAAGTRLVSLNAIPVAEIFADHAESTGQKFDTSDPLPFFLHNILGIDTGAGYKLRVPLAVEADGSIVCAAAIPQGALVYIMSTTGPAASTAAESAVAAAPCR